jgi:hypothetical protein
MSEIWLGSNTRDIKYRKQPFVFLCLSCGFLQGGLSDLRGEKLMLNYFVTINSKYLVLGRPDSLV